MHLPARQPFKLELYWLRSQAFRWRERNGWYYGVVKGHPIKVRPSGDETMRRLVEQYGYMRILRQDPWECLVSYICSQNNNIDRIAGIVDMLACKYGDPSVLDGVQCNSFPSPERLFEVGETELDGLGLGLDRGSRIWTVARDVTEGRLDLNALSRLPYERSKSRLRNYKGIGLKIADCVCLFALDKAEAFPVDRHTAAALSEFYGKKHTAGAKNVGLLRWAREHFGPDHAGYANQLLFYDRIRRTGAAVQQ